MFVIEHYFATNDSVKTKDKHVRQVISIYCCEKLRLLVKLMSYCINPVDLKKKIFISLIICY